MIYEDRKITDIEKKAKKTSPKTFLPEDIDVKILKTIPYEYPYRKLNIEIETIEFTCLCPFSGLPDFAKLTIQYTPHKNLIELKSLKYYLYSYRNVKIYNEHVVNKILEDLKSILKPHKLTIIGEFTVRGGLKNKVIATYKKR